LNCFLCQKCGKKRYSAADEKDLLQKTCDCGGELKMEGVAKGAEKADGQIPSLEVFTGVKKVTEEV
jgi:hypothetical protein